MKRKSIAKIASLALAVSVMASTFVGCGQETAKPATDAAASTAQETSAKAESTAKAANADEPSWKKDTSPITFDWYLNFAWFPNKWGVDPTSQYITQKTGVTVNFVVPAGNENEKLSTMIASNSLPDYITLGWWEDNARKLVEGGLVYSLDELAEKYDPYFNKVAQKQRLDWYRQADGKVYGYPNASYTLDDYKTNKRLSSNQSFLVKKDMYEAIGKPDMKTPDGFLNALKAAKEKFPTVNGAPMIPIAFNEFGPEGNYSFEDYLVNLLNLSWYGADGKYREYKYGMNDPEIITWFKTFRKANEMGLIAKDVFVDKRAQIEEKMTQGRFFSMIYQWKDAERALSTLYAKDPNSVYISIPAIANSKGDNPSFTGPGIAGWTQTFVSKKNKNPERAIKFMSYWMSEEGQMDFHFGKEGQAWEKKDGKPVALPEASDLKNKNRADYDKKYGADETFWMLMDNPWIDSVKAPDVEPFKQPIEFTYGKLKFTSEFDNTNPPAETEEGQIFKDQKTLWGKVLPKLILAKSDAEVDQLWAGFQDDLKKINIDKLWAYKAKKVEENRKKLGMDK